MQRPLAGRITLVTGASRGLGRAAALALAEAGSHIVAVARTVGGLEELDDEIRRIGGEATLVPLDLKDGNAIDTLGAIIFQRWGRVDGVLGNAGVLGVITPVSHLDVKVWDEAIAVNLTANWRLIRSMDPLLRQSPSGRALFITSAAPRSLRPYWGAYSVTKAGLEALVRTYAGESARTAIRANLIDPGPLRTAMRAKAMPGEDPMTLREPSAVTPKIVEMLSPSFDANGTIFDVRAQASLEFA
ncbi:MAG: SDR family NAD(P)-dependent oxidoreductase [Bauldia sp.]|nr:SDR family NAD(P)-dependent oxidoreductase [Bauldia sp.]MCW5716637.1 SDR family NAD(P)-dependent oxidoreductase [Bauldia sp.]